MSKKNILQQKNAKCSTSTLTHVQEWMTFELTCTTLKVLPYPNKSNGPTTQQHHAIFLHRAKCEGSVQWVWSIHAPQAPRYMAAPEKGVAFISLVLTISFD